MKLSFLHRKALYAFGASFVAFLIVAAPFVVYGADPVPMGGAGSGQSGSNRPGIQNPLGRNNTDLVKILEILINAVLTIAIPIIALLIMYVGLQFVMARGDVSKITAARSMLRNTLIGTCIVLAAAGILRVLEGTITQIIPK